MKKVFAYGANSPLPLLGKFDVLITYKESSSHETLYVVSGACTPLLSFSAASSLGLVQITYSVGEVPDWIREWPTQTFSMEWAV